MNVRHAARVRDGRTDEGERVEYVEQREHRSVGQTIRLVVVVALLVGLVLVALDNTDDVRVGYVFGDASAPIWIVLVAAAAAGIVIGWLFKHLRHRDSY